VTWIILFVVVLLLADVYLFYPRLITKLDWGKIKKQKTKKTGHGVCWIVFTVQRIRWTGTRLFKWSKTLFQACKGQKIDKVCIYVVSGDFFKRAQSRATVLNSYYCLLHTISAYTKKVQPIFVHVYKPWWKVFFYTREEKGGSKFIVVYYSWQDICHPCIFLIGVNLVNS
jgi:hypothetical protein